MTAVVALLLTVAASPQQTAYDTVYDQLKDMAPLSASVAPVRGLVLRRDAMELQLDSGSAYLLTPVAGRTIGMAFVGKGSLSFIPPLIVEQFNLRRVLGDSSINGPITAAVFIFADSTATELTRTLTFSAGPSSGGSAGDVHDALEYLLDGRSHAVDPSLMTALLNQTTTRYFSAYIKRQRGESVMIQFDPTQTEEVSLLRRGHMVDQRTETVCQFQRAEDLVNAVSVVDKHPQPLVVDAYDIDAAIDRNYHFKASAAARLIVRRDRHRWIPFRLYDELDVDSVMTAAGAPLVYYRRDHASPLWIQFEKPIGPGDTANVRVVYHGGVIGFGSAIEGFLPPWWDKNRQAVVPILDKWAFIKTTTTWFPRYDFEEAASVALTFHTPKDLKFATIGRLVHADTAGNVITTRWVSELPTDQVSFNIGEFDEWVLRDPRIPPVTVQVNTEAHRVIGRLIPGARRPEQEVGTDVANSLAFFSNVYGPPLFHQYYATEIPYFHGQAFPGMIHLSWWTFLSRSEEGSDESFRAHEMAHQWWGIGVEPASYRDAWIAEGFAEFSGLWYMQLILNDNDKYLKKLRLSRHEIRLVRGKSAPIGLGYRAAENWRGAYFVTTYQKGAWVLHMLRNMMLDTRTMGEERFMAMMRDFYETYRGKRATTFDFQHMVEKHVGRPMDWFFDEWVYGTAIPTYTFAWKVEHDSAGYAARIRVRQTEVPAGFGMYVPVLIKFDQGDALTRVLVVGPSTETVFRLPAKPSTLELNPFESVLAEVKTEGWD